MKSGIVSLVAGDGKRGVPADGAEAKTAPLVDPRAAAMDAAGNVYILERGGNALRVVDPQGRIRTVVGTGKAGNTGDGGPALAATMSGPKHLCVDADGSILIADTENHVIRRYDPRTGVIDRLAGTGKRGKGAAGLDPLQTALSQPHGVYRAKDGTLYICDWHERASAEDRKVIASCIENLFAGPAKCGGGRTFLSVARDPGVASNINPSQASRT